jgi:hypothetical protein
MEVVMVDGTSRWFPLRYRRSREKWVPRAPVPLPTHARRLVFWSVGDVLLAVDLVPRDVEWTFTSFWSQPSIEELDQPSPGCRVYTRDVTTFIRDSTARS